MKKIIILAVIILLGCASTPDMDDISYFGCNPAGDCPVCYTDTCVGME